jgi:hypothetical protein
MPEAVAPDGRSRFLLIDTEPPSGTPPVIAIGTTALGAIRDLLNANES